MRRTLTCYKPTSDNWCRNYKGDFLAGYVKVSFHENISPPGREPLSRANIWGNDDTGMEFDGELAFEKFKQVLLLEDVSFDALDKLGFINF